MKAPLVSVIMPAYNAGKHIAESVRSVLAQTYGQWELIVVDDGSRDETAEIVRRFAAADARIKLVSQPNGGQGKARNTGIRMASGELVAFLDADDLWEKEKLQLQVDVIEDRQPDVVFSDGFIFSDDDTTDESQRFATIRGEFAATEMFRLLFMSNRIPVLSAMVRLEALQRVGLFDPDRRYQNCEDYDLWLKLARAGAVFYGMPETLVRYRRHTKSMSFTTLNMYDSEIAVLEKHARLSVADHNSAAGEAGVAQPDLKLMNARLKQLRAEAVKDYLHQYQMALSAGRLTTALAFLRKAARIAPAQVLHPRWLLRTLSGGVVAAFRHRSGDAAES